MLGGCVSQPPPGPPIVLRPPAAPHRTPVTAARRAAPTNVQSSVAKQSAPLSNLEKERLFREFEDSQRRRAEP